jgi:hypothetical protein
VRAPFQSELAIALCRRRPQFLDKFKIYGYLLL